MSHQLCRGVFEPHSPLQRPWWLFASLHHVQTAPWSVLWQPQFVHVVSIFINVFWLFNLSILLSLFCFITTVRYFQLINSSHKFNLNGVSTMRDDILGQWLAWEKFLHYIGEDLGEDSPKFLVIQRLTLVLPGPNPIQYLFQTAHIMNIKIEMLYK